MYNYKYIFIIIRKGVNLKIEMNIEPAKAVKVIHQAFKRYETDSQPSSALNETADTIITELKQGTEMFGVYDNDELIALVKCVLNDEFMYFSRLSVLPKNQGKGVATNLVKYLEGYAVQNNIFLSKCKVRKSEKNNIALYTKLGYKIVKEEIIINKNGDEIPAVTMQKNLTTSI